MKNETIEAKNSTMKIVVIGGTGLIGTRIVNNLRQQGHTVIAASPSRGINSVTCAGLAEAMAGAQVVVDVPNSPSFEDRAVMEFFQRSTGNVLAAAAAAGVRHYVALSIVGTDRLPSSGYFRAKLAQEKLIAASPIPYTIVRATQFLEFLGAIAGSATEGQTVRLPSALFQPIFSGDVSDALTRVAVASPRNGVVDLAGPVALGMDEFVRRYLKTQNDPRTVSTDESAPYFGAPLMTRSLVPLGDSLQGSTTLEAWLARSATTSNR